MSKPLKKIIIVGILLFMAFSASRTGESTIAQRQITISERNISVN